MNKLITYFKIGISTVILSIRSCFHKDMSVGFVLKEKGASISINKGILKLGSKVKLRKNSDLKVSHYLSIGEQSEIGAGTAVISTKTGKIDIGNNVFLNRNCTVVSCENITIGAGTAIGYNTVILDHDHYFVKEGKQPWNKIKTKPVIIGENVWIGANVTILAGTNIGNNAVIAAGSVIKGTIPASKIVIQKRTKEIIDIKS